MMILDSGLLFWGHPVYQYAILLLMTCFCVTGICRFVITGDLLYYCIMHHLYCFCSICIMYYCGIWFILCRIYM